MERLIYGEFYTCFSAVGRDADRDLRHDLAVVQQRDPRGQRPRHLRHRAVFCAFDRGDAFIYDFRDDHGLSGQTSLGRFMKMNLAVSFVAGVVMALGLCISQMINPAIFCSCSICPVGYIIRP